MRVLLLSLLACLVAATPAQAAFTLANPSSKPADVKAGANSDVSIHVEPQDGDIKDLDLHLPAGLIGDPNATARCPLATFRAGGNCPADTQVGTATNQLRLDLLGVPASASGPIFNIQPEGGEPARLGIRVDPPAGLGGPILLESPVTTRPTDQGLDSTLRNIPNTAAGQNITITALDVVLFGRAGAQKNGKPFMRNPTSCAPAETVFDAVAYDGSKSSARATFTPTACEALPFDPSFSATLGGAGNTGRGGHPELLTVVGQQPGEAGTRSVAVTLPTGVTVGFDDAATKVCQPEQVEANTCPPTSIIGSASAVTPLLTSPLSGPVTFAQRVGETPFLLLQLRGQLSLTLRGFTSFTPDGLQTTFDGLPDVPLSRFELRFIGGPSGLLVNSVDLCAAPLNLKGRFTAQSGKVKDVTLPARVDGCPAGGGAGDGATARAPKATLRLRGRSLRLGVDGRGTRLRRVRLALPKGVQVARRARGRVRGTGTARLRLRRKTIEITVPGRGAPKVGIALRPGSIEGVQRLRRRAARVTITTATGERISRRLKATR